MTIHARQTRLAADRARREALGFATRALRRLVHDLGAYRAPHGDGHPLRAHRAVDWACRASATRGPSGPHARLRAARGFWLHLPARLPEPEVPARSLLAAPRRPHPALVAAPAIRRIRDEAGRMGPRDALRPWTPPTLCGLLACTGLRPREARTLLVPDVQRDERPPRRWIRPTKVHPSGWVPRHLTAAAPRRHDAHRRRALQDDGWSAGCFRSAPGGPLALHPLHRTCPRLLRRLGLTPPPGPRRPTRQACRQTGAGNRRCPWDDAGVEAHALLPTLSVSLGPLPPASRSWYRTATPARLGAAAQRCARDAANGDRS
jgi:integrase